MWKSAISVALFLSVNQAAAAPSPIGDPNGASELIAVPAFSALPALFALPAFFALPEAQRKVLDEQTLVQRHWDIVRGRWLRLLFGDRLRVFNDHPDQLPEYDGRARGPLPASVLPRWRYKLKDGRIQIYLFNRHRLVHTLVEDPRRS